MSTPALRYEDYPSSNFNERRDEAQPTMLVMHYSACPTDEALTTLTSPGKAVSTHYLLPPEGERVFRLVDATKRAWHAGVSHWKGMDDVNSASIGIENVNWGYTYGCVPPEPLNPILHYSWSSMIHLQRKLGDCVGLEKQWHSFPDSQINTLTLLSQELIGKWHIEPENVVGHSDVAPQRKVDPGPLFPWKRLAEKGVGVWHSSLTDLVHSNKPQGVSVSWMQKSLKEWGYKAPQNGMLDPETQNVIAAFQMHFRPQNYDGRLDSESAEILDRLLCQRRNRQD
jgi:N-acetylmuramoyl-L-alanine amidase